MAKPESSRPRPPPLADADLGPTYCSLEKFGLYETRANFYLIGSDRDKRLFRVLKIDRSNPSGLNICEDSAVYSLQQFKDLLQRISDDNRATGGLAFVTKFYGIAGCVKFLESYYLILVKKRCQIGSICGHAIYGVKESQMITIPHPLVQSDVAHSKAELWYKKLLSSVDLTKDFFYSYTYPIMWCLQKNVIASGKEKMPYENMFVWNAYLTQAIRSRCSNALWTIALVHGHFNQVRFSNFGREFSVVLISRRSRHFAGTRYLKRGVNNRGRVANDVETEQVVLDEDACSCRGKMSSVVQMRGSIPLFWSQEASRFSPKPDIILQRNDPTYQATKLHFEDLANRYGNPIIVLNLIKTFEKRPREMILRREFANVVRYLNQNLPEEEQLKFIHWDFKKFARSKSANVLVVLGAVASEALDLTSFYYSGKPAMNKRRSTQNSRTSTGRDASHGDIRARSGDLARLASNIETLNVTVTQYKEKDLNQQQRMDNGPHFQSGVLRTNCLDCLDRTNVSQYAYGLAALGRQLHAMGLSGIPKVDPDSSIAAALMDMYHSMGDALAQQYGGSAAHNTVFPERQGKWKTTTQFLDILKSVQRYYSNAYTDGEKQDSINLFLGYSPPIEVKPVHWELDCNYGHHVSGVGDEPVDESLAHCTIPMGKIGMTLAPIPACKQDFVRMKLTSFDKLIERKCSLTKNVTLGSELNVKAGGGAENPRMAPDAAEIQLKSPNWLFGRRKNEESVHAPKVAVNEKANGGPHDELSAAGFGTLNWLSSSDDVCDGDILQRYLAMTSVNDKSWYGGALICDQDKTCEVYKHYAELCQGLVMNPLERNPETEKCYSDALRIGMDGTDDSAIEAEMEAALKEHDRIGADLGIALSCNAMAKDPSWLTRWIIGEERVREWGK